jgi:uncharacterized coiled-coil protein SlyX
MNDNDCRNNRRNDPFGREAKRAAWRARRAARHAGRGDWSHFGDPKFWGLDAESMKAWGLGGGMGAGMGMPPSADSVAELEDKVARMEKTIASLNERIIVLERLALNDDARLAAEIERLRETDRKKD